MANATTKRKRKPRRGLGYTVETIKRKGPDGRAYRIRYRAYVWNAAAQVKQHVINPENGSKTFDEWDAADRAAQRAKAELDGNYIDAGIPVNRRKRRMLLDDYIDYYLENYPAKTQWSQASRKTMLNQARKRFPGQHLHEVHETDLRKWDAESVKRKLSESARQGRIVHLNNMYKIAIKEGYVDKNPCADIHFKRPARKGSVRRLREPEFQKVYAVAPEWFKAPLLLAFDCAMRCSEVAGLTWKRLHLDDEKPWVHIKDIRDRDHSLRGSTKHGGERIVALSARAAEALRELKAQSKAIGDDDPVILHGKGQPLVRPGLLVTRLRLAFDKAGVSGEVPKFHHLRHSCLAGIVRATKDVRLAQQIAGHFSLETTQRYLDDEFQVDEQAAAMELRAQMALVEVEANRGPGFAALSFQAPAA